MFTKINNWRERHAYRTYAKLNVKRKSKEASLKVYQMFDSVRRKIGYVK